MSPPRSSLLDAYLRHRRVWEIAIWVVCLLLVGAANSAVALMDVERGHLDFPWWAPVTWEFSSVLVLLALVPAQLAFERRFPFRVGTWARVLPWHLLATVVYSLLHVLGMVGLRKVVYAAAGSYYDFGNWPRELLYEYLKDVRTYAIFLTIIYFYRLLLLRLQGEARIVEAVERPERFLVRKVGTEFLIAARDIEWLEAAENYVNFHIRGRAYPLRSTMTAIQERLDPQRFVRVHRSYIVNLDFLVQIEPQDTGDARLLLKDGTHIPCSRRYRQALRGERAPATASV